MLSRVWQWWEMVLGCIRARAISMPGTTLLTTKDMQYRLVISDASVVITDEENAPKIDHVLAECPSVKRKVIVGAGSRAYATPAPPASNGWLPYESLAPGHAASDALVTELQEHSRRSRRPTSIRVRSSSSPISRRRSAARSDGRSCATWNASEAYRRSDIHATSPSRVSVAWRRP
jgi:acyl-CoA synthetase (AMP-forming)/AMP-acid ligase II